MASQAIANIEFTASLVPCMWDLCSVIQTANVTGHNTDDIPKHSQTERF